MFWPSRISRTMKGLEKCSLRPILVIEPFHVRLRHVLCSSGTALLNLYMTPLRLRCTYVQGPFREQPGTFFASGLLEKHNLAREKKTCSIT